MLARYRKRLAVKFTRSISRLGKDSRFSPDAILARTAASIFRISIKDPAAKLLYSPGNAKRLIRLEHKGMYIVLDSYIIEITNHSFSYHLELGPDVMNRLTRMFDTKLRVMMEEEEAQFKDQRSVGLLGVLDIVK